MATGRTFKLNSGYTIPAVGLGTWQSAPREVEQAVECALRSGYKHIDAASIYGNEQEVGAGWKKSGVSREDFFLTSKLWNTHHHPDDVEKAVNQSLKDLQTEYLDLYLIHWPVSFANKTGVTMPTDPETNIFMLQDVPLSSTWAAMEKLVQAGKIRSIGVSNFNMAKLEEVCKSATIMPAVNQYEMHPYFQQPELEKYHKEKGIIGAAYSPLGNNIYGLPRAIDDPKIHDLAKKLKKDPAQVVISWVVQRGMVVLPKSVTEKRIQSNFEDFELPEDVFDALNAMNKGSRYNHPLRWGSDIFGEKGEEGTKAVAKAWADEQLAIKRKAKENGGA